MEETTTPTLESVRGALDTYYNFAIDSLASLQDPLSDELDPGGWSVKQVLSHLAGGLYRVPIHASYYLNPSQFTVPIVAHDTYWLPEWDSATVAAFRAAFDVAYHGNIAFLAGVKESDLDKTAETPFGEMDFGSFLMLSYAGHLDMFHREQLTALAQR